MRKIISLMYIACFLVFSIAALGQEKEATPKPTTEGRTFKIIQLKYADPNRMQGLLGQLGGRITVDDTMKVLTVTGSSSTVEAIEEAVQKLDVPPPLAKDVELTAYFLLAKRQPSEAADLPPALNDVLAELKNVLNYQGFTLLNTALIRTQDNEGGSVKGVAGDGNLSADFSLSFQRLNITTEEKGPAVHIRNLEFVMVGREAKSDANRSEDTKDSPARTDLAQIHTNIDVPVGQKVVVGKTAFASPSNALVLVLTAKIMD